MKIGEIYLSEEETEKLQIILEKRNEGKSREFQQTFQELAEELLIDAIYYKARCIERGI